MASKPILDRRARRAAWLFLATAFSCGGGDKQEGATGSGVVEASEGDLQDLLIRERVVSITSVGVAWGQAFEALRPLLERPEPALEDLIRAGQILTEMQRLDEAREYFDRARALAPEEPHILWGLFEIAYDESRLEDALQLAKGVLATAPDDFKTQLALANTYFEMDRFDEARPIYEKLVARGVDAGGSWYVSAVYRMSRILLYANDEKGSEDMQAEYTRLQDAGIKAPSETDIRRGSYGEVASPPSGELSMASKDRQRLLGDGGQPTRFTPGPKVARTGIEGVRVVRAMDFEADPNKGTAQEIPTAPVDLLLWGRGGLSLARRAADGSWTTEVLLGEPVLAAAPFDVDLPGGRTGFTRDPYLDVVAATSRGIVLLRQVPHVPEDEKAPVVVAWEEWSAPLLGPEFVVRDLAPVDYDHEGDLDLLVVGPSGVRLLRNDGVPAAGGTFTDVTREAGLEPGGDFTWCVAEDLDADNDADLYYGGPAGARYAKDLRGGRFEDASATLPKGLAAKPAFPDFDRDGRADLVARDAAGVHLFANRFEDRFVPSGDVAAPSGEARSDGSSGGSPVVGDLGDLDRLRVLWPGAALVPFDLRPLALDSDLATDSVAPLAIARGDVTGDGVDDLIVADGEGFQTLAAASDDHWVRLELQGDKDNRRGVGAIVELRAGPLYQRWYWDGTPRSIALGKAANLDVVRVTWPNGIIQTEVDLATQKTWLVKQRAGLVGSCPFLYTWNGHEYTFISDVLGITPLGLPIDRERLVPPDHDEYVLVRGDQLVPVGGFYEMQFTEELREVTYLDRIRLDVVDHPQGVEVFPNERFTFPPFPEPHIHSVDGALAPRSAVDLEGHDWTDELAKNDERLAWPFEPLEGQFLGLATPHTLELAFDADAVKAAPKLRLVMNGWLFWTDASVNMASAGHPDIEFVPPLLFVPDGQGGWQQVGPPLGFPAGKLKTMVVDVTDFVKRDDPRLRIFSTLALAWDSVRLAVDPDDAPRVVTSIEPLSAHLWERGFSRPVPHKCGPQLDWFVWDELAAEPRWNAHPGLYTRLGDVVPLLFEVDDRFVVMGSGDALTVRFPASGLPALPDGWTRDYLFFFDGWAKDRDPNSKQALDVEPLPFHGMSGYPYGADEHFPDTPAHREWRREWQTRPAKTWIEPLAGPLQPASSAE